MRRLQPAIFLLLIACSDPAPLSGPDAMPGPGMAKVPDAMAGPDAGDVTSRPPCVLDGSGKPVAQVSAPFVIAAPGGPPAAAFDGQYFLVVWQGGTGSDPVLGRRIGTDGSLLDPFPFRISPASGGWPAVAFGEDVYLVVWEVLLDGYEAPLRGTRVDRWGAVRDAPEIVISGSPAPNSPSVAFNGRDFLVVWQEDRRDPMQSGVYGARVSEHGAVLDRDGFAITHGPDHQRAPDLACGGTACLVAWVHAEKSAIEGARIDQSGTVLDKAPISVASGILAGSQAAGHAASGYLNAWNDQHRVPGSYRNFAARIDDAGKVLDPDGIAIAPRGWEDKVAVASDGQDFFVVWSDETKLGPRLPYGARVTREGVLLDPDGIRIDGRPHNSSGVRATYGAGRYLVTWQYTSANDGSSEVRGAIVTAPSRCDGR